MFVPVMSPRRVSAAPEDWGDLRDFIQERIGVHYPDARLALLAERLQTRLQSVDASGARDLLMRLRFDESGRELRQVQDLAAPHESAFLREPEAFDALCDEVLPKLPGGDPLRIWSAGCSAGEEVYSLRYRLGRACGAERQVELLGTDLSERCVADARRAEYRATSARDVAAADRAALFEERGGVLRVRDEWRTGTTFEAENLLRAPVEERPEMQVIFCRNVFMYLSEAARRSAAQILYEALCDGGFLFLGRAESLHGVTRAFRPVTFRHGFAYQKS
jgi:chemotaxis protein methyltransferase CheR